MTFIGPWEIALILAIVLIIFGPKKLPELAKSIGGGGVGVLSGGSEGFPAGGAGPNVSATERERASRVRGRVRQVLSVSGEGIQGTSQVCVGARRTSADCHSAGERIQRVSVVRGV